MEVPSSPNYKRDYKREYDLFADSTKAKKERAARNKASRVKGAGQTGVLAAQNLSGFLAKLCGRFFTALRF